MGVSKNKVRQNGWFIMENTIKMDDLEVPIFFGSTYIFALNHVFSWVKYIPLKPLGKYRFKTWGPRSFK